MRRCDIKKRGNYPDTVLAALWPDVKDYRLFDSKNLYFYVKSSGKKSWQFRYKNEKGNWSWLGLGAYPRLKASQARAMVRKYLKEIDDGVFEVKGKNKAIPHQYTFKALMSSWLLNRKEAWATETYIKAEKSISKHIYPVFCDWDYRDITRKEWFDFFVKIKQKNINTQLKKLLSYVRGAYCWSGIYGVETFNPVEGVTKFLNLNRQDILKEELHFLSIEQLAHLLRAIRGYPNQMISIALELSFHTIARPSELVKAQWSEFDLKNNTWTIPAHRMKNRKVHKIPFSQQVVELLMRLKDLKLHSKILFPHRFDHQKCISDNRSLAKVTDL